MKSNSQSTLNEQESSEISIGELWLKARIVLNYIRGRIYLIMIVGFIFGALGYLKAMYSEERYFTSLTFALEQPGSDGTLNGLATQLGVPMEVGSHGIGGENLLSLMKTRRVVQESLLSYVQVAGDSVLLIEQYLGGSDEMWQRWDSLGLLPIKAQVCCSPELDSALGFVVGTITQENLFVGNSDKKTNFYTVSYSGVDPIFPVAFIDLLTKKSIEFYKQTKMSNAQENITLLERRVDSVSSELKAAMVGYSNAQELNNFTVQNGAKISTMRKEIDLNMLTALYGELVKNLELSRTLAAREEPLITVIDPPHYPYRICESKLKWFALGYIFGIVLVLLVLGIREFVHDLNKKVLSLNHGEIIP